MPQFLCVYSVSAVKISVKSYLHNTIPLLTTLKINLCLLLFFKNHSNSYHTALIHNSVCVRVKNGFNSPKNECYRSLNVLLMMPLLCFYWGRKKVRADNKAFVSRSKDQERWTLPLTALYVFYRSCATECATTMMASFLHISLQLSSQTNTILI